VSIGLASLGPKYIEKFKWSHGSTLAGCGKTLSGPKTALTQRCKLLILHSAGRHVRPVLAETGSFFSQSARLLVVILRSGPGPAGLQGSNSWRRRKPIAIAEHSSTEGACGETGMTTREKRYYHDRRIHDLAGRKPTRRSGPRRFSRWFVACRLSECSPFRLHLQLSYRGVARNRGSRA